MEHTETPKDAGEFRYSCIDLFAGCGGLSLGLEQAGFAPLLFSEINHSASETYIANRRDRHIVPVGDIYQLTDENLALLKTYWRHHGVDDIDLVCGGPPCQGYSGIGHRRTFKLEKKEIPSNHLFQEMVRVIKAVRPKLFLFENVKGLLSARWSATGIKGEVFADVLSAFQRIPGYVVKWELVHAKDYGIPQNRPRVLMVGVRDDIFPADEQTMMFEPPPYDQPSAIQSKFLPAGQGCPPSLADLLSDLEDPDYLRSLQTTRYPRDPVTEVQRALRTLPDGRVLRKGAPLNDHEYSDHAPRIIEKYMHMIANDGEIPKEHRTKKFAQRVLPKAWDSSGPNITATSLPEDYVHYSQPRTPTVREWARIQTFPDWYIFCGPRTTGGRRRAGDPDAGNWSRDVPRYTQIGNAVPVQLAYAIGNHLAAILNRTVIPLK